MQAYSNPADQNDPYKLPNVEIFQLTAEEAAELDEDALTKAFQEFPLATFDSREREKAIAWIIETYDIQGGWFYHFCLPGCLPDSSPMGPYATPEEALSAAQEEVGV